MATQQRPTGKEIRELTLKGIAIAGRKSSLSRATGIPDVTLGNWEQKTTYLRNKGLVYFDALKKYVENAEQTPKAEELASTPAEKNETPANRTERAELAQIMARLDDLETKINAHQKTFVWVGEWTKTVDAWTEKMERDAKGFGDRLRDFHKRLRGDEGAIAKLQDRLLDNEASLVGAYKRINVLEQKAPANCPTSQLSMEEFLEKDHHLVCAGEPEKQSNSNAPAIALSVAIGITIGVLLTIMFGVI